MGGNGGKRGKPGKLGITQKNRGNGDLLQMHYGKYVKTLQEERKMKGKKRGGGGIGEKWDTLRQLPRLCRSHFPHISKS